MMPTNHTLTMVTIDIAVARQIIMTMALMQITDYRDTIQGHPTDEECFDMLPEILSGEKKVCLRYLRKGAKDSNIRTIYQIVLE
jgi:hypothetical protein